MGNVYIAINGDDVGTRIGNAIANDDHQDLANASATIDQAHKKIDEWADGVGGKKITGSGDEAIYLVPDDALAHMDSIRQDYQDSSGHGLTVGVGASMSQASKALIYGKMNGKNQTIHYDPNMEDYLSDEAGDEDPSQDIEQAPEIPGEGELEDQAMQDDEAQAGEAAPEEGAEEPAAQPPQAKGQQPAAPKAPVAPGADLQNNTNIQDGKAIPKGKAMSKPAPATPPAADPNAMDDSAPADDSQDAPIGNEDDVSDDNEEALNSPDSSAPANKAPKQQAGEIDGKTDKDFGAGDGEQQEDEAGMDDASAANDDMADGDVDTDSSNDDFAPAEGEFDGSEDDSDSEDQDLGSEDVASADGDEDPLASMIHGDMSDDDGSQDDPMAQDDSSADDSDHQELKQDIANALLAFKDNKMMLEQAREQNPDLYNATLTMLRSMISMAKKLGFSPEQDMQQTTDTNQMADAMPEADDQGEESPEGQPADDGAAPADDKANPEKK